MMKRATPPVTPNALSSGEGIPDVAHRSEVALSLRSGP